jgi:valyl-tRNA synthetase
VDRGLQAYNPSVALGAARDFFWGSLCDWYLELIKARLQDSQDATAVVARQVLAFCLDQVLRLFHPFVPFITEHLWQRLGEQVPVRGLGSLALAPRSKLLVAASWPTHNPRLENPSLRDAFGQVQRITRVVREVRATHAVPPSRFIRVSIEGGAGDTAIAEELCYVLLTRLARAEQVELVAGARREPGSASTMVGDRHVFVRDVCDDEAERERLQKALAKVEGGIAACEAKLANPQFVSRAPAEVVQAERERLAALQVRGKTLLASLTALE